MSSSSDNSPQRSPPLARLTDAVSILATVFEQHRISYALIGGLGVALRGNRRATEDIDILREVPSRRLPSLLEAMQKCGCSLDVIGAIRDWNEGGMLAFRGPENVPVDILKAVIPLFHRMIERASPEPFGNQTVRVADAESLLLLKLIAFRPLDQEDIRAILLANSGVLDLEWVLLEATNAGLGDERLSSFKMLVQEFYQS